VTGSIPTLACNLAGVSRTPVSSILVIMHRGLVSVCVVVGMTGVAAADPKMLKGPYLQDLAPTSITVMWQLEKPAPAKLVVTGPGGERVREVTAMRIAEATVDGLVASSRYRYRVEVDGASWAGEFATAPPVGKDVPFQFIVVGDSRDGMEMHRRVVERMSQEVPDFVLGTGDMVDDGSRQDEWQQFFDVENRLLRDNVYFPAVGNHDRQGRGRTADTYRSYFSVPENGRDTERYYAFSYASARFIILDSNMSNFALVDQTSWLERELMAARQDPSVHHIFAVMHHPTYSISLHGGARELRDRWGPLFEKYQVSTIFSGHDHVYERAERNGIRYFVTGGGGAPVYPRRPNPSKIDSEAVKKFERVYHYLRVIVTGRRIEVSGIRTDGTIIETTTWMEGPTATVAAATAKPGPAKQLAAGAPQPMVVPPAAINPAPTDDDGGGSLFWIAIGGVGLLLAAACVVVVTLRR
jgi:predicted phosphodiesterase